MHKKLSQTQLKRLMVFIVLISIFFIGCVVYLSGGTSVAFTHLMYVPIIIAAFTFDMKGAVAAALLSGLVVGPWMPLSVSEAIMQKPLEWMFRIMMFLVIGIICALLFKSVKNLKDNEIQKSFHHMVTGLPNDKQLQLDLTEMIKSKTEFSLIMFRITNIDEINRYANYETGLKAIMKAIEVLVGCVNTTVYSVYTNEFAVILPSGNRDPYLIGINFLNQIKEPLSIDRFKIHCF